MGIILFIAALLPAILLWLYIWKKDIQKEPTSWLVKAVLWGVAITIPVAILESGIGAMLFGVEGKPTSLLGTTTMAFVVAAALAGMAGALYAMNFSSIVPKKFDFNTSILILVFVVLGGMGNIRGGIISAALLTILPEKLRFIGDFRMLIYAVVLICVMLFSNNAAVRMAIDGLRERFTRKDDDAALADDVKGGGAHA